MIQNLVWVFVGGGIGSVSRFLFSTHVQQMFPGAFPWGTLSVNFLGCAIIGVLWAVAGRELPDFLPSVFLFAGLLGGFTTFSSFGLETFALFHDGAWMTAIGYVLLTNVGGLLLTAAGFHLTTLLMKGA